MSKSHEITRENRRRKEPRSAYERHEINLDRGKKIVLNILQAKQEFPEHPHAGYGRPKTRGECYDMPRPCPYVSCKHHLAVEVSSKGLRQIWPHLEPEQWPASCILDVIEKANDDERDSERGKSDPKRNHASQSVINYALKLKDVGIYMNLTHEAVRLIEKSAIKKLVELHPWIKNELKEWKEK